MDSNLLMVVGGYDSQNDGNAENDVEFVNLKNPNSTCVKPKDSPLDSGSTGTFIQGQAIICGSYNPNIPTCYSYNPSTDEWIRSFATRLNRDRAGSVQLGDDDWWILGGYSNSQYLETSEICHPSKSSCSEYLDFEGQGHLYQPKAVRVNATHIFIVSYWKSTAWLFDQNQETFTAIRLEEPTSNNVVTAVMNQRELVILDTSKTYIYDLNVNEWRLGPYFNHNGFPAPVQYKNSFLLVGASTEEPGAASDIFTLDPDTYRWVKLSAKLKTKRTSHAAFLVPDDFVQCS